MNLKYQKYRRRILRGISPFAKSDKPATNAMLSDYKITKLFCMKDAFCHLHF